MNLIFHVLILDVLELYWLTCTDGRIFIASSNVLLLVSAVQTDKFSQPD